LHPTVYTPSEDTYLLLRNVLREVEKGDKVLEVGAGSGVISEELSKIADLVVATEINPYAARVCSERGVEVVLTDIARGIMGKFDLIVFNPPYLPEEATDLESLTWCGGKGGVEIAMRFLKEVSNLLSSDGRILIVLSSLGDVGGFKKFAESLGFKIEILDYEKLFFETLYVLRLSRDEKRKNI
jgi:release factor glutamine methyltransferase